MKKFFLDNFLNFYLYTILKSQQFCSQYVENQGGFVYTFYCCVLELIQGYPQSMRLQTTVYFLIFIVSFNYKLLSFFSKSLNKPLKDYIQDRRLNLNLGLSYLKSFKSSLQSLPLWVTLQVLQVLVYYTFLPSSASRISCLSLSPTFTTRLLGRDQFRNSLISDS